MNQILATEPYNNKKNKKSSGNAIEIKKIIVFFACAIFIFGVIIIGVSIYKTIQNNKTPEVVKPTLKIERMENVSKIKVEAEYSQGITKISYYWSEDTVTVDDYKGRDTKKVSKEVDIPAGATVVEVEITGEDGEKKRERLLLGSVIQIDTHKDDPTLAENELRIIVRNEEGLKYIEYKWDDDQEVRVDAEEENAKFIEEIIDIDSLEIGRGDYNLVVTAVDSSNKETKKSTRVEGKYNPEITFARYDDILEVMVKHEKGFERIEIYMNGTGSPFIYDESSERYDPNLTEFPFPLRLQPGENTIIVVAYSLEGTSDVKGVQEYVEY